MSDDQAPAADAAAPTDGTLPPVMAALWRQDDARRPGPRPGLSVDAITATAIELADTEGLPAVSMARLAERLGVTTMALYRYVGGKDELLARMYDAALRPPDLAATGPWRDRLEAWCRAQLVLVRAHPWVVSVVGRAPIGPHRVRWLETGLAALADSALPPPLATAVVGMLSLHVLTEGHLAAAVAERDAGRSADHPALVDYGGLLRAVVDPAREPHIAAALAAGAFDDAAEEDADQEFALALLLDGVEALERRCAAG
nr:TetR/AcrR family transcriptional regulator [uncultured Actinotalea sp.]